MAAIDPDNPTPELVLMAYARGIFPMGDSGSDAIHWFSPDPRGILPLEEFRVSRSLARVVRQSRFEIRVNTAFDQVIRACSEPRSIENGQWITPRLRAVYEELARRGFAHSVEAWRDGKLAGGLYGLCLGATFFGESMFTAPEPFARDASKVCLVHLIKRLRAGSFTLLDIQFVNPHLRQFGAIEIPREQYLERLHVATALTAEWESIEPVSGARGPGKLSHPPSP